MEFEWASSKATKNARKHRVTFEEAQSVFADALAVIFDDPDHSDDEQRELIIGHSDIQRLLIVSFTERSERIRIIGARLATKRERQGYEQDTQAD
jgi:uncharacterized DUF497 family protein